MRRLWRQRLSSKERLIMCRPNLLCAAIDSVGVSRRRQQVRALRPCTAPFCEAEFNSLKYPAVPSNPRAGLIARDSV